MVVVSVAPNPSVTTIGWDPKAKGNITLFPQSPWRSEAWESHGQGCQVLDLSELWTSGGPLEAPTGPGLPPPASSSSSI